MTVTQDGTTAPIGDDPSIDASSADVEAHDNAAEDVAVVDATEALDATDEDDEDEPFVISPYDQPGRWFVVHTYAGYENKVKSNLHSRTVSMSMEDRIYEVVIPMEDVAEIQERQEGHRPKEGIPRAISSAAASWTTTAGP